MEHRFTTRPAADAFIAEHHPDAEPMPAVSALLGGPYFLDRAKQVTVRVDDFSDDVDEPLVIVHVRHARDFGFDKDLADQVANKLEDTDELPELQAAVAELGGVFAAGLPSSTWQDAPDKGVVLNLQSVHDQLQQMLTTVAAVRDAAARSCWEAAQDRGETLETTAKDLFTDAANLADMVTADRRRFLDL